ncbi:MAG TPA: hypothetical protein VIB55_22690 [Longimicrobium sp.]|jgi:hypothetical protein
MRVARALLMAAALFAPGAARAQASPLQTAEAFLDALRAGRWEAAAALLDPRDAAQYQESELSFAAAEADRRRTGELRADTTPVWTMASARLPVYDTAAVELLPGYRTIGEHAALPPARFVALALQAWSDNPYVELLTGPANRILGEVMEDDSTAHVLMRREPGAGDVGDPDGLDEMDVLSLRRVDGHWHVVSTWNLLRPVRALHVRQVPTDDVDSAQ